MPDTNDMALLREFARHNSETAFAELVQRHLNLVYSVALRCTASPSDAQDVAQAVFIILARKAARLNERTVLTGWLYETTRLTAAGWLRTQQRRQAREQEAYMQSTLDQADPDNLWRQLAPHLEEAMSRLKAKERTLLALRFYENKTAAEAAALLGIGEEAVHKRTTRALEKLRTIFTLHGVALPVALIAGAISANSLQAAPAALAKAVTVLAVAKGAAAGVSTLALVKDTLKTLTWTKYKAVTTSITTALIVGTVIGIFLSKKPISPVIREPLTDSMRFMLESPPGGLALQPDGKIIVGTTLFGRFVDETNGSLGFYTRGAFRLNPDGTLDRTFRCEVSPPGAAPQMDHVEILPDGRMFLSGLFGSLDGKPSPNYAVLLSDGTADDSFQPWRGETNPPPPFFLPKIDSPHIWGLTSYQGGAIPATWLPNNSVAIVCKSIEITNNPYSPLTAYLLDSSGKWIKPESQYLSSDIYRPSGLIDTLGHVGFSARAKINWKQSTPAAWRCPWNSSAKSPFSRPVETSPLSSLPFECWTEPPSAVDAAKVLRALFEEIPIELCRYAVRLPDGGAILAVRDQENTGITAPGQFMRFDKNWLPDFSFTNQFVFDLGTCPSIKRQPDGKFLIAGFGKMNGEDFSGLIRLLPDGQIDRSFHCETVNSREGRVMDMVIQHDGKIVICGFFSKVNGVDVPHIARLNPDGSLDPSFQTAFMTQEKFYQEFSKSRRVAVAKLSTPAATNQTALVAKAVPETILITFMKMEANGAMIQFTGAANHQYVLQAKDSLAGTDWQTLGTNRTTGNGIGIFRDASAAQNPMRFYRIATP